MWEFERYRRTFAVDVATGYMQVLETNNQVRTARDNYERLIEARRRATRMAEAGRLPGIQVDQALQDELRARRSWVGARQNSRQRLDQFRILLGLPPDADVRLDDAELKRLQEVVSATPGGDAAEYSDQDPPRELLEKALRQRRDLKISRARLEDRERAIMVAADALKAEATLLGSGSTGEGRSLSQAEADDGVFAPARGRYAALLSLDLPLERHAETVVLRRAILAREQQLRNYAALEDEVKYQVRNAWGQMREALETIRIQEQAVKVARRRVASTGLFLKAGRIQMRDLLEAQDALVAADNALVGAQVEYLIAELRLKRDLGELEVDYSGALLVPYIQEGFVSKSL
jgi:outer membrane protein TolC